MDTKAAMKQQGLSGVPGQCPFPRLLVINVMIPDYSPKLKQRDGAGYSVVIYAKLSEDIQQAVAREEEQLSPALNVFKHFVQNCCSDKATKERFKVIGRVANLKHSGFNWSTKKLIHKFNATPFLSKESEFHVADDGQIMTIDFDAHQFGYIAKTAWNHIKHIMENVVWDL